MSVTGSATQFGRQAVEAETLELGGAEVPSSFGITLAAGAANAMSITVAGFDRNGDALARAYTFVLYMSEATTGLGLTGDTYSGDLVASSGVILGALTAKKAWIVQTDADGEFVAALTATAKPADQRVVCVHPVTGALSVSAASGTNWGA